jgi:hypothetical protein
MFFTVMEMDFRPARWPARAVCTVFAALLFCVVAACSQTSGPGTIDPTSPSTVPLLTELVGRWVTQSWLDNSGSQAVVRTYQFTADGRYEYSIGLCRSSTDCTIQSAESGYVRAARGLLALQPRTRSSDGLRSFPYAVGRDPDVGDVQLHLTLADGQVDIFYAG